ncbi:hypothetical protein ACJX0J_019605, partial [Zea mays]
EGKNDALVKKNESRNEDLLSSQELEMKELRKFTLIEIAYMLNISLGSSKEEIKSNLKSIKEMEKDRQINKILELESRMKRVDQDSDKL